MQFIPQLPQSILFLFNLSKILYNTSILNKLQKQGENIMKLSFNKRAVAVALSLAFATPIISTTAIIVSFYIPKIISNLINLLVQIN